ncbi:MAG: hypothetical protein JSW17_03695 [Candidatus Omnitrophota bacterium]|nr:MAG: hypothetical protein JSW17_03695 [Candidatus Omnitrophota bacterium]
MEEQKKALDPKKRPLGVTILGGINCFILGGAVFLLSILVYINLNPESWEAVLEMLKEKAQGLPLEYAQFKNSLLVQATIAAIYAVSGAGLLLRKEWARKLTLYFSFAMVLFLFISALTNPRFITQAVAQVFYPAILIIYFTNKKVESYFKT